MSTDYRAIVCALLEGHSYRSIARECGCSSKTVAAVRRVVDENQWTLDRVQRFLDAEIQQWFPDSRYQRDSSFTAIDLDGVVTRMRSFREANPGKTFTVKVEHERYVRECETAGGKPYSYKQFAAYVSEFVKQNDLSWPLTHDPGRVMFVDWSGDKMLVGMPGDPDSFRVSVFVATLPHSGMVFAKCYHSERTPQWIQAHVDACEYFGGVPLLFVPDNASTASFRPAKNDPAREICTDYRQFAEYYHAGVLPAQVRQPKNKAHVERHVKIIQDWVGQFLAGEVFDTLDDLNDAVLAQVEWLNREKTPYRGADQHTRWAEFVECEQACLQPLPEIRYEPVTWKWATVRPDCHFQVDKRRYSVPYTWVGKRVKIGLGEHSVKVYSPDGTQLIVAHERSYKRPGSYVTLEEHRPPSAKPFGKLWTRDRYEKWASHIGFHTLKAITIMLDRPRIEQHAFLTCENTLLLGKRYSNQQLEQACKHVLDTRQYVGYRAIKDAITVSDAPTEPKDERYLGNADHHTPPQPATEFTDAKLRGFEAFSIPTTERTHRK